jgi:septal ring factor EnvC (AmiA/AmiB activator)
MITLEKLQERKGTIQQDIKKVEDTITSIEAQREQLRANLFALRGAVQQVDFFITECEEETNEDKPKWDGVDRRKPPEEDKEDG